MAADELSVRLTARDELAGKLKATQAAVKQTVGELTELNKALDTPAGKKAYDEARTSLAQLSREQSRLRTEIGKNERAIRDFGSSAPAQVQKIEREVDTLKHKFGQLKSKMQTSLGSSGLGTMASRGVLAVGAIGTAMGALGLKTAASMEQSEVAFTNLLGSKGKAKKLLDNLSKMAAETPFEFPQLVDASQKLLAFGFGAKDITPMLTKIGDAAAGTGAGAEGVDRITRALGQMQAKGKISNEELMQLGELGIPVYDIMAKKLGMAKSDVMSFLSAPANKDNKAGATEAFEMLGGVNGLLDGMGAKYKNMMSDQSETLGGIGSTLKDTVQMGLADLIKPYLPDLKQAAKDLTAGLGVAFDRIGKAIEFVRPKFVAVVNFIKENRTAFIVAGAAIGVMAAAVGILNAVLAINPITLIVLAIGALIFALVTAYKKVSWFRTGVGYLIGAFKTYLAVAKVVWLVIIGLIRGAWHKIKPVFTAMGGVLKKLWDPVAGAAKAAFNGVARAWNNTVGKLSWTVPSWVPLIGGNTMAAPKLPMLAAGGPVTAGMRAIVGEVGPELFVPDFGAPRVIGAGGPEIASFPTGGYVIPNDMMPASPAILRDRERVLVGAGGPSVSIGTINAESGVDVEARVLHAILRADRIKAERR